ncbi:sporulation protein YabP [Natribacillus halophilus]|uniref:Sporulation protein YabP n=1 Tax=Natribacillus halophilus TaxID=549003 RepID=A0A1G8RIG5_9BACI|nr:sporulation protein YabP [Natribacillus halophilus]SDJ16758.1 sporulation protein YabP [Natribacillus halophilus]
MNDFGPQQRYKSEGSAPDHDIVLKGRKILEISGVKEVESFDSREILLETVMGYLAVRGKELYMKNLNVENGLASIEGKVDDLIYVDEHGHGKPKGFIGKLFK